MPIPRRFDRRPPERDDTRVNERIRVREVRLIGDDGNQVGVLPIDKALEYAQERDLDLVEVAADAKPPVCRVLDYSKYKYEQEQKAKAAKRHQKQVNVREIKLRPKIADNDYETKKNHVVRFLNGDDRVKVTIMFRGREQSHPERGVALLMRLAEDVADLGVIEQRPIQDGRNMTMLLAPSKQEGRGERRRRPGAQGRLERRRRRLRTPGPRAPVASASIRSFAMPKMKTHSGAKKRFRKTATGKLRARHGMTSHILEKKSAKRKRRLGRPVEVAKADEKRVRELLQRMSRVKRSVGARKKRRSTLERAKGYRGQKHSSYKRAKEQLLKSDTYAYRDRRNRKRDFRRLWIQRINAAARKEGMSYSHLHARPEAGRRSSWTARCWPTSPSATPRPSDVLPRPPGRRPLPDFGHGQPRTPRAPSEAPFFVPGADSRPSMITSPDNSQLKQIRKLQRKKERAATGLFAAEGEDLVAAAAAAGWEPEMLLRAEEDVEPHLLERVSTLGLRRARDRRLPAALLRAAWGRVRLPGRRGATPATSAPSSAPRTRSATGP